MSILAFTSSCVFSQDFPLSNNESFNQIDKNIKRKSIATFLKWYMLSSKDKESFLETLLGKSFYHGSIVSQDYKKSFLLFKSASEKGLREAQFNLGMMYAEGIGTEKNEEEALKWFLSAANKKHIDAEFYVGLMYLKINSQAQNPQYEEEVIKWWKLAAEHGSEQAKYWIKVIDEIQ